MRLIGGGVTPLFFSSIFFTLFSEIVAKELRLVSLPILYENAIKNFRLNNLVIAHNLCKRAVGLAPDVPELHNNLGSILREMGKIGEAEHAFKRALALRPSYASAHSNLLFLYHYFPNTSPEFVKAASDGWACQHLAGPPRRHAEIDLKKIRKKNIVVGLVSPDLYYHPVGIFLLPWLKYRNARHLSVIAYCDRDGQDSLTVEIRRHCDHWRVIFGEDDQKVAKMISDDKVDILIDLCGHTASNRLKLFGNRAAPVQVSWLGYPGTTGVPAMDAVLMDEYTTPAGYESFFSERLIRLSGLRFCYTPPTYAPKVSPLPASKSGYITFGSFNNLAKVNGEVIRLWSNILHAVRRSRLILKWKSLSDQSTSAEIKKAFFQHGIENSRIETRGWSTHLDMLSQYSDVDIALDPHPFSGGLTSCDALYMGIPIITLPGDLPVSRQTGSFLDAIGFHDGIAVSSEDYIRKAVNLSRDIENLRALRETFRSKLLSSRVCDGKAFANAVDHALGSFFDIEDRSLMRMQPIFPFKNLEKSYKAKHMSSFSFDGQSYELSSLSEEARAQLVSLQFVEQEIARLQLQMAALQTARNAYASALKGQLPAASEKIPLSTS